MLPGSISGWRGLSAAPLHRAVVLVPLTLLSASWTLSAAGAGQDVPSAAVERQMADQGLPALPAAAAEGPASATLADGALARPVRRVHAPLSAPAAEIPAVAMAAYQRAETVIDGAAAGCHLSWSLVAAIGRVESDHGRVGRSHLDLAGVARPRIMGVALDGANGTALVSDSDGGRLDGDETFDRAVGPLQFIPTTWGVVGVDADGDGERNPQDIDDAALAAAVYLCSGGEDLADEGGLRGAVHRYNHSDAYVDLVMSVMASYQKGGVVPFVAAGVAVPPGASAAPKAESQDQLIASTATQPVRGGAKPDGKPKDPGAAEGSGTGTGAPSGSPDEPVPGPVAPTPPAPDGPVAHLLTRAQAVLRCTLTGLSQLLQPSRFEECVERELG